jgi:ADP-ribose pyrophosphatase
MAMGHVVLTEFFRDRQVPYFTDYVKAYTDLPFLVTLRERDDGYVPGHFLTAVDLGEAGEVTREYVRHPGAVAVAALDEQGRLCLIQQYRHPVRAFEWEIPAGLLDVTGEPPHVGAARELHEEADLVADTWHVLADYVSSPGGLDEALRIYLARDLSPVPESERHVRDGEELGMPVRWVPLEEIRDAVLAGRIHNATITIAVLAALAARDLDWTTLRAHDAPWPSHPAYRD